VVPKLGLNYPPGVICDSSGGNAEPKSRCYSVLWAITAKETFGLKCKKCLLRIRHNRYLDLGNGLKKFGNRWSIPWAYETGGGLPPPGLKIFRASASCSKYLNNKNISVQWRISGQICFSRQAQVAQKSWLIKIIKSIQWKFSGKTLFQGKCKLFKNAERWRNFQCSDFSVYSLGGGPCKLG